MRGSYPPRGGRIPLSLGLFTDLKKQRLVGPEYQIACYETNDKDQASGAAQVAIHKNRVIFQDATTSL